LTAKGRIYIAGAVIPFAMAAGLLPAASAKSAKPKVKPFGCTVFVTTQVPGDETIVLPSAAKGQQWGSIRCGKRLGWGAQKQEFSTPDTGDVSGTFTSYLRAGTFHGSFVLTQQEGTLTSASQFASASYTGRLKIAGGSGLYKSAKGRGTTTCTSQDGLHFKCVEKLALTKH
jgi:hypothetical protein